MPDTTPRSVVVDTSASPNARLAPVAVGAVRLNDTFWVERRRVNRVITLPSQYNLLEQTGRLDNFRRAADDRPELPYQGAVYNDSDVYKWLEAACWTLAGDADSALEAMVDTVISLIAAAQQPDGYLNTYFMFDKAEQRWTNFDLHEMYCAGHLFQAAVAHYRATGKTSLLGVARRLADYLDQTFGPPEAGKRRYADGHEEVEMALVELARVTCEERYLDLARFFIDVRGHGLLKHPNAHFNSIYYQDDRPFRDMEQMAGHAVRAVYYNCGVADVCAEYEDGGLRGALDRLWDNMTTRRMYANGAIGSRYEGEAFGQDYELPNERSYAETCAAIGNVMWNFRLLALTSEARYADLLENALYNAVLPGISLDGHEYFYQNPLADGGVHRRQPWFGTACCPPNIARLLASLPGYVYGVSDGAVWAHLYAENSAEIALPDGRQVRIAQKTSYPWSGDIDLQIYTDADFSLHLRVPAWCETGARLWVNEDPWAGELVPGSYVELRRSWQAGDLIRLRLPMPVRSIRSHPFVAENSGRIALMRGPLLYCVEGVDYPDLDIRDLELEPEAELRAEEQPDLLNGVVLLRGEALAPKAERTWGGHLYLDSATPQQSSSGKVPFVAIPYYAWANRAPGRMQVWLRTQQG